MAIHDGLNYAIPPEAVVYGFDNSDWAIADTVIFGSANEVRSLKGEGYLRFVNGRYVLSPLETPNLERRQTVLSGKMRPDGKPTFLKSNGFAVDILAAEEPLRLAFAAGYDAAGAVDFVESIAEDIEKAWTLEPNTTTYLYIDRLPNGKLAFGKSNFPPHYGERDRPKVDFAYNLCDSSVGGKVIWNSFYTQTQLPEFAFQDNNSIWMSGANNPLAKGRAWIGWDFGDGNPQEVRVLHLEQPGESTTNGKTSIWLYQVSGDLENWTTICTLNSYLQSYAAGSQPFPQYELPPHGKHRAFRVLANEAPVGGDGFASRVRLIKAYGAEASRDNHWFDTTNMVMYADGVPMERLFVGEVLTNNVGVAKLSPYAFLGRECVRLGINSSRQQTYEHDYNLGCDPRVVEVASSLSHNRYSPWTSDQHTGWGMFKNVYGEPTWDNLAPDNMGFHYYLLSGNWYWLINGVRGSFGRNGWRSLMPYNTAASSYFLSNPLLKGATAGIYSGGTFYQNPVLSAQFFVDRGWN